jgi:hypothetical protein
MILDRLAADLGLVAAETEVIRNGITATLDGCYDLLTPVGFPFGYRTAKEVFSYIHVWVKSRILLGQGKNDVLANWPEALDKAVLQKVLPKIHGNRRVLGDSLGAIAAFLGVVTVTLTRLRGTRSVRVLAYLLIQPMRFRFQVENSLVAPRQS